MTKNKKTSARKNLIAARRATVAFSDLLSAFSDDPVFARFLLRKVPDRIQHQKILEAPHISKIRKIILSDRELKKTEIIDTLLTPFAAKTSAVTTTPWRPMI
ncbi:MAG: hypothetical protein R2860_02085 [Desulfobacterales bacterium]